MTNIEIEEDKKLGIFNFLDIKKEILIMFLYYLRKSFKWLRLGNSFSCYRESLKNFIPGIKRLLLLEFHYFYFYFSKVFLFRLLFSWK